MTWYVYIVDAELDDEGNPVPKGVTIPEGTKFYMHYDPLSNTVLLVVEAKLEGLEPIAEFDDIEPFTIIG